MRLTAWWKFVPLAQLAAYVLLVWYGCWYRPTWQQWFQRLASGSSESAGFYPAWIDGIESLPEQLAAGIDFPAVAAAALSLLPFDNQLRTGASKELAIHVLSALYVPLLWLLIVKRLDKPARLNPVSRSDHMKAAAIAAIAGLLLAAGVMLWTLVAGKRYIMGVLSLLWICVGIVVICFWLRQPRRSTAAVLN